MYLIFYYSGVSWLRFILGDVTAVTCLMYAATNRVGLKSSTGYYLVNGAAAAVQRTIMKAPVRCI